MIRTRINVIGRQPRRPTSKRERTVKSRTVRPKTVLWMAKELKAAGQNLFKEYEARRRILEELRTRYGFSRTYSKVFLWRLFSNKSINAVMAEKACSRGEAIDLLLWRYIGKNPKRK